MIMCDFSENIQDIKHEIFSYCKTAENFIFQMLSFTIAHLSLRIMRYNSIHFSWLLNYRSERNINLSNMKSYRIIFTGIGSYK